jgi:hypothetical protein
VEDIEAPTSAMALPLKKTDEIIVLGRVVPAAAALASNERPV